MSEINTGGPAFPCLDAAMTGIDSYGHERWEQEPHGGMTLRDYFAAKAMEQAAAQYMKDDDNGKVDDRHAYKLAASREAYEWADAMLKARSL